jgi:hypothetical protein
LQVALAAVGVGSCRQPSDGAGGASNESGEAGERASGPSGVAASPSASAGAGPVDVAAGGGASPAGGAQAESDEGTQAGGAGGGAALDATLACTALPEGTYCGQHIAGGEPNVRYFCADDTLIAQAECPGICAPDVNECSSSTGSGQGAGDSVFQKCPACFQVGGPCAAEFQACDALCRAHISCLDTCDSELGCTATCTEPFAQDTGLASLNECAGLHCVQLCDEGTQ